MVQSDPTWIVSSSLSFRDKKQTGILSTDGKSSSAVTGPGIVSATGDGIATEELEEDP